MPPEQTALRQSLEEEAQSEAELQPTQSPVVGLQTGVLPAQAA